MPDPRAVPPDHPTDRLVGHASALHTLRTQIRQLAGFDAVGSVSVPTVLLHGETGTGKGLVAHVLHDSGPRAHGPFIDVNCAAIPETMLEAELFGFEAGAFTDAKRAKAGLFEAASGGTLFLDEVDAVPLVAQSKLLKILEEKHVRRLGAVADRAVDVKLVAATSTDLYARVAEGRFRLDLYHRLAVVLLELPPLRARGEDIVALAQQFLARYAAGHRVPAKRLSSAAEAWLARQAWPGNVRELSHLMERVTLLHAADVLDAAALARFCLPRPPGESTSGVASPPGAEPPDEPTSIRQALIRTAGNVVRAAQLLGLRRDALRYRMRRYGIRSPTLADLAAAPPPTDAGGDGTPTDVMDDRTARVLPAASGGTSFGWEHKPVAVLAIELTFPTATAGEAAAYEPWTTASHWEQALVAKVQGFGGVILQRSPALMLVAFGIPHTLEQLPQRAVQAALALRHLVAEGADQASCPVLRLVMHWGEVLVDGQARDPTAQLRALGETLAWPVRLLGHAVPGEILLSPAMGPLVEGWCEVEPREVQLPGGPPGPIRVSVVVGNRPPWARRERQGRRPLSPFVGRDQELATLRERVRQVEGGRGQVVGVFGDPGTGKSRLCDECVRGDLAQPWRILHTQGTAVDQVTPYLPIIDLLTRYFQLDDHADRATIRHTVHTHLQSLDDALTPTAPAFLTLLEVPVEDSPWQALEAAQRRQRTLDALREVLVRESQVQPVLLLVEDLHWIDTETQAFLDTLVDSLPTARLLLLVNYRPEYQHSWGHKTAYTHLRLDPLPPASAEALLRTLLGDDLSLAPLTTQLIERTEGNPFFLEESVRTLVETGVLAGERGAYRLTQALPSLQVPATVQAVLAARIDRLPPEAKQLLQTAAVIGTEVPGPLLTAIADLPDTELHRHLTYLQAAEFLYETCLFPELEYTFKHALTQEVVYNALLLERRRGLHERTGQAIEALFPSRLAEHYGTLVHHYSRSGNAGKAVEYLQRAGQQAVQRSAYAEAIGHVTTALDLLRTLPDTIECAQQELVLQTTLAQSWRATKGSTSPEVERAATRARELCQQVGETRQLLPVLSILEGLYRLRAELATARELAEQLLRLAQRTQEPVHLAQAHTTLGMTLYTLGELVTARAHLEQAIAVYGSQSHGFQALRTLPTPWVSCLSYTAWVLWLLGYPEQALEKSQEALTLAQEQAHPFSLAQALLWAAGLCQFRRERAEAQAQAETAMILSTEQGFPVWLAIATMQWGWALAAQGHGGEGIAQIHQGLAAMRATGVELGRPHWLALLAEAYGHVGQTQEGLTVLAEALATVHSRAGRWWEAELYRLKAELLLQSGVQGLESEVLTPDPELQTRDAEAEACLHQALEIARHQEAKSLELRAAMSLVRLWQQQGKRTEAYKLLAPIYGWFTEGFDTADLQEAKALLEALA